jgi:hypothetical protein
MLKDGRIAPTRAACRASCASPGRPNLHFLFKSLGNILVNPSVGILFIAMHGKPQRLRVNGEATVSDRDPLLAQTVGAQLVVRVAARAIFPNCPRYIPTMQLIETSKYAPQPGCKTPEPAWKDFADFKNYVHPRQPTFKG